MELRWEDYASICFSQITSFQNRWHHQLDTDELRSIGMLTFVKATDKWKPDFGVKFAEYYKTACKNAFLNYTAKSRKQLLHPVDPACMVDFPAESYTIADELVDKELLLELAGDARVLASVALDVARASGAASLRALRGAILYAMRGHGWTLRRYYGAVDAIRKTLGKAR